MRRILLAFLMFQCLALSALGHDPGLSSIMLVADGPRLRAEATLSPLDLNALIPLDGDGNGEISDAEIQAAIGTVHKQAASLLEVRQGGIAAAPQEVRAGLHEDNLFIHIVYPLDWASQLEVRSLMLQGLPIGHRQYLALQDAAGNLLGERLLDRSNDSIGFDLSSAKAGSQPASFGRFALLGIGHILKGYDHLLFLFGLLIVCATLAESAKVITAFTLAHSVTLALAAMQWVWLPSGLVEALIAASVVAVGIENLLSRRLSRRWLLAFGFGLIHGLGFASALGGLLGGAAGRSLIVPLCSFNLGVEIGQIALAAAFIPLLRLLRRQAWLESRLVPACSLLVIAAGGFWLADRIL